MRCRTPSGWAPCSLDDGKAPVAVPSGGKATPARSGTLSLPAPGAGEHDLRRGLHDLAVGEGGMNDRPTLLLEHHLKELKRPTFLREYRKLAAQCAAEGVAHPDYLLRLSELELIDRHQRMVQRRIRAARFPAVKTLDTFDFMVIPSVNKALVHGAGPLRVHTSTGRMSSPSATAAPARPTLPWGPGRLPARNVRGLHHRRGPGPRTHGGPGRPPAAQSTETTGPPETC